MLKVIASILLLGSVGHAYPGTRVDSDGILRWNNGEILLSSLTSGWSLCPQGTHIPTIRELAKDAEARGAKGILELNQVPTGGVSVDYQMISTYDDQGHLDRFWFSGKGYKIPEGDLGKNDFWTDSTTYVTNENKYYFRPWWREFRQAIYSKNPMAVRCFPAKVQ